MKYRYFVLVFIVNWQLPIIANACKPLMRGRYENSDKMIQQTETVVLAKVESVSKATPSYFVNSEKFDYVLKIVSVLKGNYKNKQLKMFNFDGPEAEADIIGPGLDCENHGGFKINSLYLIFLGSANEKAIKRVTNDNDAWVVEIKNKIAKQRKK